MHSFNFGDTAGASQSSFRPQLPGNEIHEVQFDGVEIEDIQGKKDPTQVYKVLKLKFSNDKGTFEHTIFEPRQEDFVRTTNNYTDKQGKPATMPVASNVEAMKLLIKHAIDAIVPAYGEKIDKKEVQFGGKDWEQLRQNVKAVLDKGKGVTTKIKLINDNKGNARFPGFFTGVNTEDQAYVRNNFIGNSVGFTAYEKTRIGQAATAKPTPMGLEAPADDFPTVGDLNMDFDVTGL